MTPSIRLGRIFGIEVGVKGSLIFVFARITWSVATTVFPQSVPNQSQLAYWGTAVLGRLAFYLCLLAHELSHAVVAWTRGVKVSGITLWLFGGVGLRRAPEATAGARFRVGA